MADEVSELTVHIEGSTQRKGRRLPRSRADLALVGLVVVTVLLATRVTAQGQVADQRLAAEAPSMPSAPPMDPFPRLVAPGTAAPGERVAVLGYQHRGLCASDEILLDGQTIPTQRMAVIEAALSGWDGIIVTLAIPPDATPGPHELTLLGALPGSSHGADTCVSGARPRGRIATSTILVSSTP